MVGLPAVAVVLRRDFPLLLPLRLGDVGAACSPGAGRPARGFSTLPATFPVLGLAQASWLGSTRSAAYLKVIDTSK